MPSPGQRVIVTESLNRNLNKIGMWCDLWGIKFNVSKTMIVYRSRTVYTQSTSVTLDGTVLKESVDLVILWVTFDVKMTFEKLTGLL